MAPLRYAAKFDPFLPSLDCAPTPSTLAQSKERKGSNFAIWQPCFQGAGIPPSFLPVTHDSLRLIDQTKTICEQRIYLDEAKELYSLISSKFLLVCIQLITIFLIIFCS